MNPDEFINWVNSTFYFYLFIPYVCYFLPKIDFVSSSGSINQKKYNIRIGTFVSTLILLFIKCFSITGRDIQSGYRNQFFSSNSLFGTADDTLEIGFRFLNFVIYHLGGQNFYLFLFICGFLTLFPVIYFVFKYGNNLNISLTLFLYATLFYFQGFSLLRLYLASSIALFSIDDLLHEKTKKSLLWLLIAFSIHRSVIILLFVIIIYALKSIKLSRVIVFSFIILLFSILAKGFIISHFTGRYAIYQQQSANELGFAILLKYLPLFILVQYARKKQSIDRLAFSLLWLGFEFGILSYFIPIIGRQQAVFLPIIFLVGYFVKQINFNSNLSKIGLEILFLIYGTIQLYLYIKGYYQLDGIMPYVSYLGFNI